MVDTWSVGIVASIIVLELFQDIIAILHIKIEVFDAVLEANVLVQGLQLGRVVLV